MGARYLVGRGVVKDLVIAHLWLNIASANGDEPAREGRDLSERQMNRAEISRATVHGFGLPGVRAVSQTRRSMPGRFVV